MKRFIFVVSFLLVSSGGSLVWAQDFALKLLEKSPRHHEWVEIPSDGKTLYAFVAYPEK